MAAESRPGRFFRKGAPKAPEKDSASVETPSWFLTPEALDGEISKILPAPPSIDDALPKRIKDITALSSAHLMQSYWSLIERAAHAQSVLGITAGKIDIAEVARKEYEMRFRYDAGALPKAKTDMRLGVDEEYREKTRSITVLHAFKTALQHRIEAYTMQAKTLSRELSRRGIESELARKGI